MDKIPPEIKVKYLADSKFELLKATGLEIDLDVAGLGKRLSRFAIFIDNGPIKNIFDEEGGGLEKVQQETYLRIYNFLCLFSCNFVNLFIKNITTAPFTSQSTL